jgi:hypothetical protein
MYLPEDDPGAFSLFIFWVYRLTIPSLPAAKSSSYVTDLVHLCILAEKLMLFELLNRATDRLQDTLRELSEHLTKEAVLEVYRKTPSGSRLRRFGVHSLCYEILENRGTRANNKKYIRMKSLKQVLELAKESEDLCLDLQFHLFSVNWSTAINDMRTRDETSQHDRCFFHYHKEGDECHFDNIPITITCMLDSCRRCRKSLKD